MRIPINNIYRAFEELDDYTDQQCKMLMQRVKLSALAKQSINGAAFLGFIIGLVAMLPFIYALLELLKAGDPAWQQQAMENQRGTIWAFGLFWPAAVGALIGRDMVLRKMLIKAINVQIDRVRCPECKYILIGQREHNGSVTCPECGHSTLLRILGLVAADLIPPDSALMPLGREMESELEGETEGEIEDEPENPIRDPRDTLAHLKQHQADNPVDL